MFLYIFGALIIHPTHTSLDNETYQADWILYI